MQTFLYSVVALIAGIHSSIMTWNDGIENSFTDKELHFIVIGVLGLALICAVHPLFLWLSKKGHTMVVSFLYVATVILVVTFAIEIGQGATGTGAMEFGDISFGIAGFLFFFAIFIIIRAIVHLIIKLFKKKKYRTDYRY